MLFLADYTRTVPHFGSRCLDLADLQTLCEDYGIYVLFTSLELLHGCSFFEAECPYIVINSCLTRSQQIVAGYHEFVHLDRHLYITPARYTACSFKSTGNLINLSRMEFEAQAVGLYALMPDVKIRGMSSYDLMAEFDVDWETAIFRLSLNYLQNK